MPSQTVLSRERRYHIPTHLSQEDRLEVSLLGIPLSFTLRQGVIILVGWSLDFALWQHLAALDHLLPEWGNLLRLALTVLVALSVLFLATLRIQGRAMETWLLLWLQYTASPRLFIWKSLTAYPDESHQQAQSQVNEQREPSLAPPWSSQAIRGRAA